MWKTKKTNNQTGDFAGEIRQSGGEKWYSKCWKLRNRREIEEDD
jgi:hypothetical protein